MFKPKKVKSSDKPEDENVDNDEKDNNLTLKEFVF